MKYRLKLNNNEQIKFFANIKTASNLSWHDIAKSYKLSGRTLSSWASGQYYPLESVARALGLKYNIQLPHIIEHLDLYWSVKKQARAGAIARYKLYGAPGTIRSRQKGGTISQMKRRLEPDKYKKLGCNVRKLFPTIIHSVYFAELCGILLGDGHISDNQITITLNRKTDASYSNYVSKLLIRIFNESPHKLFRKSVVVLILSGADLVKQLKAHGLKSGNKVKLQVDIPKWIMKNDQYYKACVRGLIDTDGGVYFHHHICKGNKYTNFGLSFANKSNPLINGVNELLNKCLLNSKIQGDGVYIYNFSNVKSYFKIIGSSNSKHIARFKQYLKIVNK